MSSTAGSKHVQVDDYNHFPEGEFGLVKGDRRQSLNRLRMKVAHAEYVFKYVCQQGSRWSEDLLGMKGTSRRERGHIENDREDLRIVLRQPHDASDLANQRDEEVNIPVWSA